MDENDHEIRKSTTISSITYEDIIEEVDKLNVNHLSLQVLPKSILKLTSLKNLSLSNNCLEKLPEETGLLVNLRRLDVSDNRLKQMPKNLLNLKNLISLKANNNFLTEIPDEIGRLQNLYQLELNCNKLKKIPLSLRFCNKLRYLYLDHNYLQEIPNNLVFLPRLRFLPIQSNQLLYLPSLPFSEKVVFFYIGNAYLNYYSNSCYQTRFTNNNYYGLANTTSFKNYVPNLILEIYIGNKIKHIILNRMYKNVFRMSETHFPSLLEITLRFLWKTISTKFLYHSYFRDYEELPVPATLTHILLNGPIDECTMCRNFIFFESVVWVVQKTSRHGYILLTVNFCSTACAEAFKTKEEANVLSNDRLSANMIPWDLVTYKNLSRKRARQHDTLKEILKKMKFKGNFVETQDSV